jgi:uridine phosphorylase
MASSSSSFLGAHTLLPALLKTPPVYEHTILRNTGGQLPPYLIVVGDRRRVQQIAALLDEPTLLHHAMHDVGANVGRVDIAVGLWKGTPVAIMEHQMGCAATEINVREAISREQMTTTFRYGPLRLHAPAKYVIRVGSAAGLNSDDRASIAGFDLIVASHQVGVSGTDLHALTGQLNFFDADVQAAARLKLAVLGYGFDQGWPLIKVNPTLTSKMAENARAAVAGSKISVHVLGNVSKDSLYAEAHEARFVALRRDMDVGSSEMEFSALIRLAAEQTLDRGDPVIVGMIVSVLGLIPGSSFLEDTKLEHASIDAALRSALDSLHQLSLSHREAEPTAFADEGLPSYRS